MKKVLLPSFLLAVLLLLLVFPARYFSSVERGVLLFASSVLPSMLPYFFFTKLLTATGCVGGLTNTVGKAVGKMYNNAPVVAYPLLMSLLSGYPVGARVLGDLYNKGLLSGKDAARAASFCSTSGSMFVLGSVGAAVLKDGKAAVIILISHYLGALINGLFYRGKKGCCPFIALPPVSADAALSDAMYESVLSLFTVGGFIAVANLVGDMFFDLLSLAGAGQKMSGSVFGGFLYSAFEVTRGCVEFAALTVPRSIKAACCCFAVSFGGLSVLLQSLAFLGGTGLKGSKFLLMKTTQALVSFALCIALGSIFL